ncbi:DUF2764 family protein [Bacteroides sp. 519]|uniref:DUF2764 family protein n=1 Tax=Bacteroides sp. 519 TaxID=2302937 RepID=UPI0013CF9D3E|nr:DUF2764 family protein [Bacteroides sp. 519]NDV59859.1 DUF2764 domain-containing protein [Bacteroides sp. 519]
MAQYYYLIAGLPDITLDDGKLSYTVENFKTEIYPELTDNDKKVIDLFYLQYDNANLLDLLKNKESSINTKGNYSADELLALIDGVKDGDQPDKKYPSYLFFFLTEYFQLSDDDERLPENILAAYYYEYAIGNKNQFVSSWFEFNLNVNNIFAALIARKYKYEIATHIIGNTEVSEAVKTSNARDFGLTGTITYWEELVRISEIHELTEREKKIDLLKWGWMEEESFFNYFTVEKLFVFLVKLETIERWLYLDKEAGSKQFREFIQNLKDDVRIPEEFRK